MFFINCLVGVNLFGNAGDKELFFLILVRLDGASESRFCDTPKKSVKCWNSPRSFGNAFTPKKKVL